MIRLIPLFLILCFSLHSADNELGFQTIFNGKNLNGWDGEAAHWSVKNGVITGVTDENKPLPYNKFLIWRGGKVKNFELRVKIKLEGSNNSGIQYRSAEYPENGPYSIKGYQCDIHAKPEYHGMLYDERGRGIVAKQGEKVVIDSAGKKWKVASLGEPTAFETGVWNEYTIIAKGNNAIHKVNGVVTADITDLQAAERELEGLLAFQVHRGPSMKVQIKDVRLKHLADSSLINPTIPSDAEEVHKPRKKKKPKAKKSPAPAKTKKTAAKPMPDATPVESLFMKEGFKAELLYTVPKDTQGSWVAMTVDHKGRLIVSDQYGSLYRITVPPKGKSQPTKVEPIKVDMGHAQGLLYAFDSLYVVVNAKEHGGRGLYRVKDTNNDDQFDHVELLQKFEETGGEHGPHAVILSPDKKSLYVVVGNQTALPPYKSTMVPPLWGEDNLLPRIYGRGFMRTSVAPRGWIAKCDPNGKNFEIMATGFRNQYDAAFNRDGELFTYDADMEWDLNTPWYRPTRVNHVVSGAEFGWRNGSAKWPTYFPDSLPETINIGPGSPTGVTFGYGAKFPAKYQDAFFIADWSYGKLYAVHLEPNGSSYKANFEEFIAGSPFPITDLLVNPKDNAMYIAIGGRRVQSALYRITYEGKESTKPSKPSMLGSDDRDIRKMLESYHRKHLPSAIEKAWPYLNHTDRNIRFAARVAIEHQEVELWQSRAVSERDPQKSLEALLALTRCGAPYQQASVIDALSQIKWEKISTEQKLALLRVYTLSFMRMGKPEGGFRDNMIKKFDKLLPTKDARLNHELLEILVYLNTASATPKGVALLNSAPSQEEQINYARSLRFMRDGWTMELRKSYFTWLSKAQHMKGGASFSLFIKDIITDASKGLTPEELAVLKPILDKKAEDASSSKIMASLSKIAQRGSYKNWKVSDLAQSAKQKMKGRNFKQGRDMFGASSCFSCHRYNGEGGIVGPDLSGVAGRFSPVDLLEAIIEPSKEISDQYGASLFTKHDGSIISGRIANLSGDTVRIITDMFNPGEMVVVKRSDIKTMEPAPTSMMPPALINMLEEDEILDLLAYLLSRGDSNNAMFK